MGQQPLQLSAALSTKGHTRALKSGEISPEGISLGFVEVDPIIAAYRRMIRSLEFDVCELAPIAYLAAREAGIPITALPVFVSRKFHHDDLLCRADSGIAEPKDLAGRRVGIRAYTVSTAVWVRGILASEYGVDVDAVTWVVDDEEHVPGFQVPANVVHVAEGDSLAAMFQRGELDAAIKGVAGVGRSGAPRAGWAADSTDAGEGYRGGPPYPLLAEPRKLATDWCRRTGIYPIHGLIAMRAETVAADPWIVPSLTAAFEEAKQGFLAELRAPGRTAPDAKAAKEAAEYTELGEMVGGDPLPYGIADNAATLQALVEYAFDQHITTQKPDVAQLFAL